LITGAAGQVGSEIAAAARLRGFDCLAPARADLDISDLHAVDAAISRAAPDLVVNAAAYTAVDNAESDEASATAVNRDGAANLATSCVANRAPLIQLSTDYVFDGRKAGPYGETDRAAPLGVYGRSKAAGEQTIRKIMDNHLILRVGWVFGAAGHNFVKTMLRLGAERSELGVVDDQRGGPTPAAAIAEAVIEIADRLQRLGAVPWGTYHFQGRPETTWHGFACAIFEKASERGVIGSIPEVRAITTAEYPVPARRPANGVLDCTKWTARFATPLPDWRDGLDDLLDALAEAPRPA
jgi:dTDP-4-dehydrorhamnose reductase